MAFLIHELLEKFTEIVRTEKKKEKEKKKISQEFFTAVKL